MATKIVEVPGMGNVEFPDSMDDAAIASAIRNQLQPKPAAVPVRTMVPSFNDERTPGRLAWDQTKSVLSGIPQAITGLPEMVSSGGNALADVLLGRGTDKAQQVVKGAANSTLAPFVTALQGARALANPDSVPAPTSQEFANAAGGAGSLLGALLLGETPKLAGLADAIPSTAKAGAKFQQVMGAAKDVPIDLTDANAAIERAQELRTRGSSFPKVFNDYVKNRKAASTNMPTPMTYEVGRDFASNAGALSTRETTAMNAQMQRQVAEFSHAMKTANREAAAKVGMGDLYDQAMKEYRQAKTIEEATAVIKKHAVKAALVTALGATGAAAAKHFIGE